MQDRESMRSTAVDNVRETRLRCIDIHMNSVCEKVELVFELVLNRDRLQRHLWDPYDQQATGLALSVNPAELKVRD